MQDRKARAKDATESEPLQNLPELPAWKGFVVQFNRATRSTRTTFAGRIEHLSSGRRARFDSVEGLLVALETLLVDVDGDAPTG